MDKRKTTSLIRKYKKLRKGLAKYDTAKLAQNWHMQIMESFNAKLKIQDFYPKEPLMSFKQKNSRDISTHEIKWLLITRLLIAIPGKTL